MKQNSIAGQEEGKGMETLMKHIPKDCYWEDMGNLTNCPVKYILTAMEEYKNQPSEGKGELYSREEISVTIKLLNQFYNEIALYIADYKPAVHKFNSAMVYLQRLEQIPTPAPAEGKTAWRSVEELPELKQTKEYKEVAITVIAYDKVSDIVYPVLFSKESGFDMHNDHITHWQPLPTNP